MSVDSQLITGRSMTQLSFALHCEVTTFRFEHSQVQKISEEVKTNDVGYYDVLAGEVRRGDKHVQRNWRGILKYS
jgi:hypothetical protein